jgi:NitT/TauT family transport system permease protein
MAQRLAGFSHSEAVNLRTGTGAARLRNLLGVGRQWAVIVAILVAWEAAIRLLSVPNYLLPAPSEIVQTFVADPLLLLRQVAPTLGETVGGCIVGNLVGLAVALSVSQTRSLERSLLPLLVALRSIPIVAITPLLTLVLGRGAPTLVTIVALICFFPMVVNASRGLVAVDHDALELMQVLHASRWQVLRLVRWPYALPYIFAALRLSTTAAVLGAVVAEWLVADQGLGFFIEDSRLKWLIADMWAGITATTLLAILGFAGMALLEQRVRWWSASEKENRA